MRKNGKLLYLEWSITLFIMGFITGCSSGPEPKTIQASKMPGVRSHKNAVAAVKFSPDGKYLASGSWDNTIKIWRINGARGQLESTLLGHTNWVLALDFNPTGSLLASGSADSTIKLWNWKENKVLKTIKGHTRKVTSIAFSPDGNLLASGSEDGSVKIWQVSSGKNMKTIAIKAPVFSVAYSVDGAILAIGDNKGRVQLLNSKSYEVNSVLESHSGAVRSLSFSSDGKYLVSGSDDGKGVVYEISEGYGSEYATLNGHKNGILAVAFSPEGKIATGSRDRTVRIWNVDGECEKILTNHSHWVHGLSFNPDGTLLASSTKNVVILWNLQENRFESTLIDSKITGGM